MALRIIEEGLQTSIQDTGRYGYQSAGFSVSGAMDRRAAALANIAVNNDPNQAVLEMSYVGPSITFEADTVIALAGADMAAKINGKPIQLGKPVSIKNADTLQLRTARRGLHCYLAVKGGFNVPDFLGSKSASLKDQLGGSFHGKLKAGDTIPFQFPTKATSVSWRLSPKLFDYISGKQTTIRFLEGRQYHWFTRQSLSDFTSTAYTSTPQSNRMGYRLQGTPLKIQIEGDLVTEVAGFGTIQVPPDGQPIILMAESQPTGGYPKIGQVIQSDLPALSQIRPGQPIVFQMTTLENALQVWENTVRQLAMLKSNSDIKWGELET
ncbi:5-oxoprolinase/urea amidolyase family protein [Sediminibacillus dalangtanensis]|uniref:5-oxoprolinase/urea amidolyase family protein n=1 Tax=Sediminibacillus dalangtanensis TaxID=2729421 RepID=A0ABX7VV84_9BACI|nr:biotin-dependent carboxyltransferase family protein [Sediminibacillus dalangtanensis]QTN00449.1 5-oxoprolinase/urea amidolyase family protein [Sediminibacillus dalangtanensis]